MSCEVHVSGFSPLNESCLPSGSLEFFDWSMYVEWWSINSDIVQYEGGFETLFWSTLERNVTFQNRTTTSWAQEKWLNIIFLHTTKPEKKFWSTGDMKVPVVFRPFEAWAVDSLHVIFCPHHTSAVFSATVNCFIATLLNVLCYYLLHFRVSITIVSVYTPPFRNAR